jgi:hypothetical protein
MFTRARFSLLLVAGLLCLTAPALPAQQTAADSARVLLDAARLLQQQGYPDLARELFRIAAARYPTTAAGLEATRESARIPEPPVTGFGRTGFLLYNTLYGGFLGLAIPAAFGADGPEAYGAGLLIGAPLGFFASRAYARGRNITDGQAGIIDFASFWGTWQGLGWRAVFDLGEEEICEFDFCYTTGSDTAPWTASVIGGLTGLGVGLLLAQKPIAAGTSSTVFNGALWGTWYGIAIGILADLEDDDLLAAALIGGNVGVLAAIPAALAWKPASSQVRIATAAGLAGGLAGSGLALLVNTDDEKANIGMIAGGTTVGLIAGALLARDREPRGQEAALFDPALFTIRDGLRIGLPMPTPTAIPVERARKRSMVPGLQLKLLDATF